MTILLTIIHVIVCLLLILIVLLQSGKSADLAGAFGGGGSQTAFGARGTATFLSKLTTAAAVVFMLTSMTLSVYRAKGTGFSVMQGAKPNAPTTKPSTPTKAPTQTSQPAAAQPPASSNQGAPTGAPQQPK
jgi:preprotein translocase subunit SecG